MNDFTAQFDRENKSRIRRGLEPYADIAAYLMAQGFTADEARERAGKSSPTKAQGDGSDAWPDAADLYAQSNARYRETVFGAAAEGDPDPATPEADLSHGGRLPGIHSPADYQRHLDKQTPAHEPGQRESEPEASAEDRLAFTALSETVYAGAINACYRTATAGASAQ